MATDRENPYGMFTQLPSNEAEAEEWVCPIERATQEELGYHPYEITTLPGPGGHKHHFSLKVLYDWVCMSHINPLTREHIPIVEEEKLKRRLQLLEEYPLWDKREDINILPLFFKGQKKEGKEAQEGKEAEEII